ncbi:tumor necrosis factor ligand superfamily member 14-like [Mercenaria mercenaria]|uniref:tumor necrosis factor ligand superfamily member 14-like n=1 Tax=Mercenaria mercenaria TaxID=6596 RepID=UPI00234E8AC3|nr:tumor necrosis factor ligand superfamily member 14-like [Mercenaria mercenaria]
MTDKKLGKDLNRKLVILTLTTSFLTNLIAMVIFLRVEQMETEQTLCVSCEQVGLASNIPDYLLGAVSRHDVQGSYLSKCCGKTSIILDRMVLQGLEVRKNGLRQAYIKCSQNPSAQMNGILTGQSSGGGDDVIHWNMSLPSFLKGGINYRDGRLTVSNTGYYFVYFQVQSETGLESDITQRHSLYHIPSENEEAKMFLETFKPKCKAPSPGVPTTSNIGAVFRLKAHDELFVKTSHPENLAKSTNANYFGFFMI